MTDEIVGPKRRRGAPKGNKNSSMQNRMVRDTLRKVAKQGRRKLRLACEKLLDKAVDGDVPSFTVLRDTLDGKPVQQVEGTGKGGAIVIVTQDDKSVL